ncbi:hypothetical protein C8R47DRAFT_1239582 [Mycena vitilis]|nr:hypothetical protein C8R47DRAFT_1239582 [Mycena vitilis]
MEFPLLSRLGFDKAHGLRHFLVNTLPGVDFAATRDRTTPKGGLWTFKRVDSELEPEQETRGMICVFLAAVFGEIETIDEANGGFVVGLRCPRNVSCNIQTLYYKQIDILRQTISAEADTAIGFLRACWFEPTIKGVKASRKDGCFYVQLPSAGFNSTVAVGAIAEICVRLTRIQEEDGTDPSHMYFMRVAQFQALTRRSLPERNIEYKCDNPQVGPYPRLRSPLKVYGVDFAPVQASYNETNGGSSHVYKLLADPPEFIYRTIYSHTGKKRSIPAYEFSLVGCVTAMRVSLQDGKIFVYYVTLGLPPDPTTLAEDVHRKQESDLARIASVDGSNADMPFKATFGPPSLGEEAAKPTVIVIPQLVGCPYPQFPCQLLILITPVGERASIADRTSYSCFNEALPFEALPHAVNMLARMQSMGTSTLANARYGTDYDAVRKCSLDGGCLYLLKKMPDVVELGHGEYRGQLGNYTGYVVGEVDKAFVLAGSPETVLRLKLPGDATCAAVNLFKKQQGALKDVAERDFALWGGSVKESFFDLSATYPAIACVPDSFYTVFVSSPQLGAALKRHATVVMKVSMSRHDKVNAVTGETERAYRLDMWGTEIRPAAGLNPVAVNGYLSAYLFATGVASPVNVRVPVKSKTPTQASDVDFMIWMATDPTHPLTNLSYLEMDVGDDVGFMVFVPDQESPMGRRDLLHPVNTTLAAQQQPTSPQFRGNVLVMRRERRSSVFLDVRQHDLAAATSCAIGVASPASRLIMLG